MPPGSISPIADTDVWPLPRPVYLRMDVCRPTDKVPYRGFGLLHAQLRRPVAGGQSVLLGYFSYSMWFARHKAAVRDRQKWVDAGRMRPSITHSTEGPIDAFDQRNGRSRVEPIECAPETGHSSDAEGNGERRQIRLFAHAA
jgi:hypothetical protein